MDVTLIEKRNRASATIASCCTGEPQFAGAGLDAFFLDVACYLVMYPFLIALPLFDWRSLGKLHPATLTSIALLLPFQLSGAWIARSDWWTAAAPGLIGSP